MKTLSIKSLPLAIIATSAVVALLIVAGSVFASSPFDIEFPIPELGDCADKTACKAYCDNAEHQEECRAFAEKHGFGVSRREVDDTLRKLDTDGGPGNCATDAKNPVRACKKYCDNVAHIEECVAYAEEHSLMDGHKLEEAKKVLSALKRGVKLPPQCKDAESCKETCEDPKDIKTARACFDFGKEAGLLPPDISIEQAEKAFKALEEGTGPFKSFAEMRQCDNPPSDDIMQKCIEFAAQAGFMSPQEAEIVKKTGGKGPGDCRGKAQCETYCKEHGDECFAFAEQHGLIRPEDKERMKEGVERMKEALAHAPEEVQVCVKGALPELEAVLAGQKIPSPQIGQAIQKCFESHFGNQSGGPGGESNGIPNFPPEVARCLEEKLGANFSEELKKGPPSRELEEKMRSCFERMGGPREGHDGEDGQGGLLESKPFKEGVQNMPEFPPEVKKCLEKNMGENFVEEFKNGPPSQEIEAEIRACFKSMLPRNGESEHGGSIPGEFKPVHFAPENGLRQDVPHRPGAPSGSLPPTGDFPRNLDKEIGTIRNEFEKQFDKQYKEEFNRQYQQQYQQFNQQNGEHLPPPGTAIPPSPEKFAPPPATTGFEGQFQPPPAPSPMPPTTSMRLSLPPLLANVIQFILGR